MIASLAAYVHNLDPYAIKLWDDGPIRWYALSYLLGFIIGYLLIRRVATCGISSVAPANVADLVIVIAVGVMVGGRLGYLLFYKPSMLWSFTPTFPFWDAVVLWKGGMASHGGIIGMILACIYYARRHGHRITHILDLAAFAGPLGLFFGRIANFVNGELYGRACDPNLPWAVRFPQEMSIWQEPEKVAALNRAARLISPDGAVAGANPWAWIPELLASIQQGHQEVIDILAPHITTRHPSQIYQALLEGLLVFIVLALVWTRPRKPCVLGGIYLIAYGATRIVGELFREPDAHIANMEAAHLNVTRGQLLTIPMVLIGLFLIWHFGRKANPLMGGWRKVRS